MKILLNPFPGIHVDLILPEGWDHTVQWPKTIASGEALLYLFPPSGGKVQIVFVALFLDPNTMRDICIQRSSISPACKIFDLAGKLLPERDHMRVATSITVTVQDGVQVLTIV